MGLIKFPSIEQYRTCIKRIKDRTAYAGKDADGNAVFDYSRPLPTLPFRGFVKLHGTNAGIVVDINTDELTYQSRERVLSLESDNAGFVFHMHSHEGVVHDIANQVTTFLEQYDVPRPSKVAIFGEWCGKGIQKGVAISELPKMWVVFAVKAIWDEPISFSGGKYHTVVNNDHVWMDIRLLDIYREEARVFNIAEFGCYFLDIDFSKPELAQNQLVEMTNWVEEKCPVGSTFGIHGVGEGVVWHCTDWRYGSDVWFKVKGEKHQNSKVKTLAPVDVEAIEKLNDLVDTVVTESRLEWALHNLITEQQKPMDMTSMGQFIRTVYNDILKEEMDLLIASNIEPKKLGGPVANKARPWFTERLNKDVFEEA